MLVVTSHLLASILQTRPGRRMVAFLIACHQERLQTLSTWGCLRSQPQTHLPGCKNK